MQYTQDLQAAMTAHIRRVAREEVGKVLRSLIDDLNMSGVEADSRAADILEREATRLETDPGGKLRTCPVAPDVCGDIRGWEPFLAHIYETHTDPSHSVEQRREYADLILRRGRSGPKPLDPFCNHAFSTEITHTSTVTTCQLCEGVKTDG